jgi:hypothetical protein
MLSDRHLPIRGVLIRNLLLQCTEQVHQLLSETNWRVFRILRPHNYVLSPSISIKVSQTILLLQKDTQFSSYKSLSQAMKLSTTLFFTVICAISQPALATVSFNVAPAGVCEYLLNIHSICQSEFLTLYPHSLWRWYYHHLHPISICSVQGKF